MDGDAPLLFAAAASRYPRGLVPVSASPLRRAADPGEYAVTCARRCFTLNRTGAPGFLCRCETLAEDGEHYFRLTVDPSLACDPCALVSQRPQVSARGCRFLDFHDMVAPSSIENAILVEDGPAREGPELAMVRKTAENALSVDLILAFPELLVLALGLVRSTRTSRTSCRSSWRRPTRRRSWESTRRQ